MADPNSEIPPFEGTNPKECEHFVAAIRRRALDRDKQRDNEWIALFASTHFVGDALYWYEDLDPSVQNDWGQLRPALLSRFGRGPASSTTGIDSMTFPTEAPLPTILTPAAEFPARAYNVPTPAAAPAPIPTIPTPAAAAPAAPTPTRRSVRRGVLKVLTLGGSFRGYLWNIPTSFGNYHSLSPKREEGLVVSFAPSAEDEVFELKFPYDLDDALGICWSGLSGTEWMASSAYSADFCELSTAVSHGKWAIERKVWKISPDGELSVEYPKPDRRGLNGAFRSMFRDRSNLGVEKLRLYESKNVPNHVYWLKMNHPDLMRHNPLKVVFEEDE